MLKQERDIGKADQTISYQEGGHMAGTIAGEYTCCSGDEN